MTQFEKDVITALKAQPNQTAQELGSTVIKLAPLVEAGLVKHVNRKHVNPDTNAPGRGRPKFEYSLAKKGRDRARRIKVTA